MRTETAPTAWDIATDLGWVNTETINTETIECYTSPDGGSFIYRRADGATLKFSLTHSADGRVDGYVHEITAPGGTWEAGGDTAEDSADCAFALRELIANWAAA